MLSATPIILAAALAAAAPPPSAQAYRPVSGGPISGRPVSALTYRVWTADDGLPQNSVFAIDQTPDGYLWIGTLDGLVRFDGTRMTVFSRSTVPEMTSNRILTLCAARDGSLWIGTEDGGVIRMKNGRFRSFGPAEGLPGLFVAAIQEDSLGRVWAAVASGCARFENDRWSLPDEGKARPGEYVGNFVGFWREGGLRVLEADGTFVEYTLPAEARIKAFSLYRDPHGALWVRAGQDRFLRLAGGSITPERVPSSATSGIDLARYAAVDGRKGRSWILDRGRLHVREDGVWREFADSAPVTLPPPTVVFEDREGTLWIGGEPGLVQAVSTPLAIIAPDGSASERNIYTLAEGADGCVWVGSWSTPFLLDGTRFERLDGTSPRVGGFVGAFLPEPDGSVLTGSGYTVYRVSKDLRVATVFEGSNMIVDLMRDRRGALWMATSAGVIRLDESGKTTRLGPDQGLASGRATVLLEASDGSVWVGCYGGLSRIEGDRVTSWTAADGLPSEKIRSLHEDDRGSIWIGTYDGGLTRWAAGKLVPIRKRDGLFDDGVFAILDDGAGRFWMSSNRGIYAARRSELDAFAEGRIRSVSCLAFGRADGMRSAECNGGNQPAGFHKSDGTLWFPTQNGIVVIDPRALSTGAKAPSVVIEQIASEHGEHPVAPEVVFQPHESRLEVSFTAPTFLRPTQTRFRYRLEGLDDDWAEAGTNRSARYSFVPPGRYLFRVIASNGEGVWNEEGARFSILVRPAWWQTLWFRSGLALAAVAAIGGVFLTRIARLKRRREEQDLFARRLIESQETERKRIAGELHDGIGQILVVIRNRALLSLRGEPSGEESRGHVEEILGTATHAMDEVRKVAYNLRPYQLDRLGLTRAIEALIEDAGASSEIEIVADLAPLDGVFPRSDEIHVYRIVQEIVSNLVRHAQASVARVAARLGPAEVEIVVDDDGRGFDPAARRTERPGMGLSGIAERVRILGGRWSVQSAPGSGTRIMVTLPRGRTKA